MPKRHKHYNARGGGRPKNQKPGRFGKPSSKSNAKRNPRNDDLLIGGGDLMNPHLIEDYYFGNDAKENSLKSGGYRPGKVFENKDKLSAAPMRLRPVEFIKAKEVYDPSHDMILKLRITQSRKSTHHIENSGENNTELLNSKSDREELEEKYYKEAEANNKSKSFYKENSFGTKETLAKKSKRLNCVQDENLYFVDENGSEDVFVQEIQVEDKPKKLSYDEGCTSFEPILTVGNVNLNLQKTSTGDVNVHIPKSKYHPYYDYVQNLLNNFDELNSDSNDDLEIEIQTDSEDGLEYIGPEVGDSMNRLSIKEKESEYFSSSSESSVDDSISDIGELGENEEPAFGFLEEDFIGNVGNITVSNIRIGVAENSYYVSCIEFFGDATNRWIDHDTMVDLVEEMGLPENRLNAYLKHIKDSFITHVEPGETDFDIPFEDSSEEDTATDGYDTLSVISDQDEGLDDLVSYSLKYGQERNREYNTKSLECRSKGKNRKLLFDGNSYIGGDMESILQDKFANRQANKAKKKRMKADFISERHHNSSDLLKKYPYGLHIQNIKDEFDTLYKSERDTITFPPLDPHGNKIVTKFAQNYFMKSTRIGKGNSSKIYVEKTKKTRRKEPLYQMVSQLLKQRPVFLRIDVKPLIAPKEKLAMKPVKANFLVSEGEIVGEDAPEIGLDNVGRRMLEKLGWTTGQGLGPHGNQGINIPIMAKMKKNKSGLRHSGSNEETR